VVFYLYNLIMPATSATLGRKEAQALERLKGRRRAHVSRSEARELLASLSARPDRLVERLAAKGWLQRIGGGQYVVADLGEYHPEEVAPIQLLLHARMQSIGPYFLSYFSGLVEYGLTDHDDEHLFVAVRRDTHYPGPVVVAGRPIVMTRIHSDRKWFGQSRVYVDRKGFYLRGELERVLVDCLDRPHLSGAPEIIVRAWWRGLRRRDMNFDRLCDYGPRLSRAVASRAGFLLELLGYHQAAERLHDERNRGTAASLFGGEAKYGRVTRWNLALDVPMATLEGWAAVEK
jgi:predicted transcriptional regulator of viral defense system